MADASDRYGKDVLAGDWRASTRPAVETLEVTTGLVVEDPTDDFCGAVVRVDRDLRTVTLEDRHGVCRSYPLGPGFLVEGRPVVLTASTRPVPVAPPSRTASGSVAVPTARARVARDGRIFVEGRHDAELVERVWGDDLRIEGVVVEYLEGVDRLGERLAEFEPGAGRRVGVLVDHFVSGTKEHRIAEDVRRGRGGSHVLVVGHPFVDVWQAVRPTSLGIDRWPEVPRDEEWKVGVCRRLGWPSADQTDIAAAWRRILAAVHSYADLEPALLGRVEELIDFVTA